MTSSIVFVCTGNICRSPTAEGICRRMIEGAGLSDRIIVDSAGTHGYHVGEPPDLRTQEAAARRGYDLSGLRARKFLREDFQRFDLVLAMDRDNHAVLSALAGAAAGSKLRMAMQYAKRFKETDVPDPYYGGQHGFERVLDMLEDAVQGLLDSLRVEITPTVGPPVR
jgi:protein-tyrosine phosphatase